MTAVRPYGTGWHEDRLPLPGIHPIMTMQVNATWHQATRLYKWVITVREPIEGYEILRRHDELRAWPDESNSLLHAVDQTIADVDHLMGGKGLLGGATPTQ